MIRHRKKERQPGLNFSSSSWKTDKSIDEIYEVLTDSGSAIDPALPYRIEEQEEGREAIFRSESGDYQVNAHEYSTSWKNTEIDLIYFGNINEKVSQIMECYRIEI